MPNARQSGIYAIVNSVTGGKPRSEETRAKIRAYQHTAEHRAKMSAAKKGKRQPEATKEKRAVAMRARWADPEYRARVLGARVQTPEIIERRAAGNRGKKRSPEARARMAAAQRRRFLVEG